MVKPKNYYIKYKLAELENYINNHESCVKKINCVEKLTFAPNIIGTFKESIMRILSRKIGKYDVKLQGVVLDFRNTKILDTHSSIRNDSAYSVIKVNTNFYVFAPRKDATVDGVVKHINHQTIETIISVVIYRVFNVKVTFKGTIRKNQVKENDVIKIRIKKFHFDNEIPYIEGEMLSCLNSTQANTRKVFDDAVDSGISESSITFDQNRCLSQETPIKIKTERVSSPELTLPTTSQKVKQKKLNRKRGNYSEDTDKSSIEQPQLKKIKQEESSSDDDCDSEIRSGIQSKIDITMRKELVNKSYEFNNQTSELSIKSKKHKDKKRKHRTIEDDFESSLQLLFNSSNIKTEND